MKKILFSGIQPSGEMHIGNYLGAIKQWVELQKQYNSFFSIVDYHSITQDYDPQKKQDQIFNTAIDLLACGINPRKATLFIQSQVPQHTELAWILNCITPISELERMTQFKDKSQRQEKNINMGLFDYPVLMAADILLYKTEVVPVGEDQLQHVELARIIARKFNAKFGNIFPEPKSKLNSENSARVMSLTDPTRKMDKSMPKSCIFLSDSSQEIEKKIQSAVTGEQGGKNLLNLFKEFSKDKPARRSLGKGGKLIAKFEKEFASGEIKYSELKPALAQAIVSVLKPIQEKRAKLLNNKKLVEKILNKGKKSAYKIAEKNLQEIKQKIGLL